MNEWKQGFKLYTAIGQEAPVSNSVVIIQIRKNIQIYAN